MTPEEQKERVELLETLDALSSADGDIEARAAAALIRAQAARIADLEAEVRSISMECLVAHGQAEDALIDAASARNDALREAADACCHPSNVSEGGESAICRGRILSLIKEPTT